jgi:TolB-like protein/tetratricopeptide (TPR) repeat protein
VFELAHTADLTGWPGTAEAQAFAGLLAAVRTKIERAAAAAASAGQQLLPAAATPAQASARDPILTVLAFENLSADPELQYFSDGVAEEILAAMSRAPDIRVIGATSSFAFRGARKAEAAVALGASHVLDGSVRRGGNRVRISATLTEAGSGEVLWTERFDRELDDALAVQDEIAELTAAALQSKLRPAAPASPVDPAAYDLYLRALAERRSSEDAAQEQAIVLLETAIVRAPGYARAHSALAIALGHRIRKATFGDAAPDAFDAACAAVKAAAERALALDPEDIEAKLALLSLEPVTETWAEQDRLLTDALAENPTDLSLLWYRQRWLVGAGRFREAASVVRLGYELSPLSAQWLAAYAGIQFLEGNLAEADRLGHQAYALDPSNPFVWYARYGQLGLTGRYAEARSILDSVPPSYPIRNTAREWVDAMESQDQIDFLRYNDSAITVLSDFEFANAQILSGLALLGNIDELFAWVEGFIASAPSRRIWSMWNAHNYGPGTENLLYPFQTALIADPRFLPLCHRLGLCAYWAQSGHWPDFITDSPDCAALEARVRELAASG